MTTTTEVKIKTKILPKAPTEFRKKVGYLLNELMRDYKVKGKDKDFEKAFKSTFKSNLYYIIDNFFLVKGIVNQDDIKRLNETCPKCKQRKFGIVEMACHCWMLETGKITKKKYDELVKGDANDRK